MIKMAYKVKPQDYWRIASETKKNFFCSQPHERYSPNGITDRTFHQTISHGNRLARNTNVSDIENRLSANRDVYGRDSCLKGDLVVKYLSEGSSGDGERGRLILIDQMRNRTMNEETYTFFQKRLEEYEGLDSGFNLSTGEYTPNPRRKEIQKEMKDFCESVGWEARLEQEANKRQRVVDRRTK